MEIDIDAISLRRMNDHHLAKGSVFLVTSHVLFYLSGYLIHFMLARTFPPATYGAIGVILAILNVIQILLVTGIPTASSKYLSDGVNGKQLRDRTLVLQFSYSLLISVIIYFSASLIARFLDDDTYVPYIKFLPIVILARSINQLFGGFFNGYREFKKQAIHMAIDSIPRVFFVFAFVYLGYGIYGVLGGYGAASLMGLSYAIIFFKPQRSPKAIGYREIASFSLPVIIFSLLFQLIASLDLLFIKSLDISEEYVGFYASARVLSTVFTIVSASFSLTLLPSISRSFSEGDSRQTVLYIQTSLRYVFIAFTPMSVIISVYSKKLLAAFFTMEYANAGNALSILVWGWFLLSVFYVLSAMINASGRSKIPAKIAGTALFVSVVGNYFLIRRYGIEGGALATLSAGAVCFFGGLYFVRKIFRVTIDLNSTIKVCCGTLVLFMGCILFNWDGAFLFGWVFLLFASYLAFLFFLKAINHTDLRLVKELLTAAISERAKTQP